MKVRTGFVSNSSASSFVLDKSKLTNDQTEMIHNHIAYAQKLFPAPSCDYVDIADEWNVEDYEDLLWLSTGQDNFDMGRFLDLIHVSEEARTEL